MVQKANQQTVQILKARMQIRRVQMLRREYFWIPQKSLQEHIMQR